MNTELNKKNLRKNIANIITSTRIVSTVAMIFTNAITKEFFLVYIYAGLSDVLDGFLARQLNIVSEFGKKLDSASDLFFYTIMMIKIWPYLVLYLPSYLWALIWIIVGLRIALYLFVSLGQKRFLSNHTYLNKATGLLMFLIPFVINNEHFVEYSSFVIAIALISVLYEIYLVIRGPKKTK